MSGSVAITAEGLEIDFKRWSMPLRLVLQSVVVLAILPLISCRTARIPAFDPIPVPQGLTPSQVEVSILAALANTPIPKDLT
jgi:hypothetical protein